jgi:hypothetical protein
MDDFTSRKDKGRDKFRINDRLLSQIDKLLEQLETKGGDKITMRERVTALIAIGRLQIMFVGLRKEKMPDESTGSSVRKYASAFANAPRRRKGGGDGAAALADADDSGGLDDSYLRDAIGGDDEPEDAA